MRKLLSVFLAIVLVALSITSAHAQVPGQGSAIVVPDPSDFALGYGFVKGLAILSVFLPTAVIMPPECYFDFDEGTRMPPFIPGRKIGSMQIDPLDPGLPNQRMSILSTTRDLACVDINQNDQCDQQEPVLDRQSDTRVFLVPRVETNLPAGRVNLCFLPGIIALDPGLSTASGRLNWNDGFTTYSIVLAVLIAGALLPFLTSGDVLVEQAQTIGLSSPAESGFRGGSPGLLSVSSDITMLNTSGTAAMAMLSFRAANGSTAEVTIGDETADTFTFRIPPYSSRVATLAPSDQLRTYSAVGFGPNIRFGAAFNTQVFDPAAGALRQSTPSNEFSAGLGAVTNLSTNWTLAVRRQAGRDTSFAMANGTGTTANITLSLLNGQGDVVAVNQVTLAPFALSSQFAIPASGANIQGDFSGSLRIESDAALAVLTLGTFQGGFQLNSQPAGALGIDD